MRGDVARITGGDAREIFLRSLFPAAVPLPVGEVDLHRFGRLLEAIVAAELRNAGTGRAGEEAARQAGPAGEEGEGLGGRNAQPDGAADAARRADRASRPRHDE